MKGIDVTIVVINYNTFDLTCDCIGSIFTETREVSFEVILVDNASTEVDPDAFVRKFPKIRLIKSTVNTGFAGGNNIGIREAQGEFMLLLNSDAILINDVASILRRFLLTHDRVAAVSGGLQYADGRIQHNCQRFPSIRCSLFELLRLQKFMPKSIAGKILFGAFFDHRSTAYPDWIWGTCFMFHRNMLDSLPGKKLADDFFMYGEDVQWCMEFHRLGFRIGFEPLARIVHLMGMSGGRKNELIDRNMGILMGKYYSTIHQRIIAFLNRLLV